MNSAILITLILAIGCIPVLPQTPPGTIIQDKERVTPTQGGSATMEDLGALLSPLAQPLHPQMTLNPI